MQLIILPFINAELNVEVYGLVVVVLAALNTVPSIIGNSLCNARQLLEGEYRTKCQTGDFWAINCALGFISFVSVVSFCLTIELNLAECILIGITAILMQTYNYALVFFRIKIDFCRILWSGICLSLGLLLGLAAFLLTRLWPIIFFSEYLIACIYLLINTPLVREPLRITSLFRRSLTTELALLVSLFFSALVTYGDRLLLFPILGATAVSVFYISSLIGKLLVMVMSPISTVLLSYLTRKSAYDFSLKKLISLFLIGFIFWAVTVILSPYILGILYPNECGNALTYVPLITVSAIAQSLCSIINPVLLRFFSPKWQVLTNLLSFSAMLILGLLITPCCGLWGFCIACVMGSVLKLFAIVILVIRRNNNVKYYT